MKIHFGSTKLPACFRFHSSTITAKTYERECYFEHPIQWWFGLSWRASWFVGFIRTDGTRHTVQDNSLVEDQSSPEWR